MSRALNANLALRHVQPVQPQFYVLCFPLLFLTLSVVRNPKHFRKEKESADGDDIKPVMCSVRGSRSNEN